MIGCCFDEVNRAIRSCACLFASVFSIISISCFSGILTPYRSAISFVVARISLRIYSFSVGFSLFWFSSFSSW